MFRFAQHDSTVVKRGVRIFVLADTHDRLPENVSEIAKDADEIWHLGDVCAEAILDELRAIGPTVIVVRGNCDSNFEWPLVLDLTRGGLKFRLQHVPPDHPPDDVDVLLHGHTHVPRNERRSFSQSGLRDSAQSWFALKRCLAGSRGWKNQLESRGPSLKRILARDSLLIKSAAIAFLHEDEFGSRSNLRARKAMAAFLVRRRAQLGDPNYIQLDQHCRVARRISHALRAYLGA